MNNTKEEPTTDVNRTRKLDFNVRLISAKRPCNNRYGDRELSCSTSNNRVPFCWEQVPGKPKEVDRHDEDADFTPRPRLPPCRWRPSRTKTTKNIDQTRCLATLDNRCDADIDDDDYNNNKRDLFSDAMEALSLTEAIDVIVKKTEEEEEEDLMRFEKLNLESTEFNDDDRYHYTNFMIERFLPDATALAESSVALCASMNMNGNRHPYLYDSPELIVSQAASETSRQGCGFDSFLPWRMKHKLCSMNSPVVQQVSSSKLQSRSSRGVKATKRC